MIDFKKNIVALLVLEIIILAIALTVDVLTNFANFSITLIEITILSIAFFALSVICLFIYFYFRRMEGEGQSKSLLLSFAVKFLSELVLVFFWFFIGKKTGIDSLLLFFILYLAFTLLMLSAIVKALKHKIL